MYMLCRGVLSCLTALLLLAATYEPSLAAGPDPASLVLTQRDVPAGFTLSESERVSNADSAASAGLPASAFAHIGRVTGYMVTFHRTTTRGGCCISEDVTEWKDARAARNGVLLKERIDRQQYPSAEFVMARDRRSAEMAFVCRCGQLEDVFWERAYKGRYDISMEVHFVHNTTSARIMQANLQHYVALSLSRIPAH